VGCPVKLGLAQCSRNKGMQYVAPMDLYRPLSVAAAINVAAQRIAQRVSFGKFDGEPVQRLTDDSRLNLPLREPRPAGRCLCRE
jgi:hypothetical protein